MDYAKEIQEILSAHMEQAGSREALEKALYDFYAELQPIDDPMVWQAYSVLRQTASALPVQTREALLNAAEALASHQEKQAFLAGLRMGRRLSELPRKG